MVMAFREVASLNSEKFRDWFTEKGLGGGKRRVLSEVTYFTCLKMLSETMGKLPIKHYRKTPNGPMPVENDRITYLLEIRPNENMTPTTFWTTVENNRNHYGNAYVWIRRKFKRLKYGGEVIIEDLWIMPSDDVTVLIDNAGIFGGEGTLYYKYHDKYSNKEYVFRKEDVMHFKTWLSFDGITGEPVSRILRETVNGAIESQRFMNNLYENGMTASMALQYTGDLEPKKERKLREKYEEYCSGANNAGRIVPVPIGLQLIPLNVKLTDSQFFELKKYTALQIAGAFGVKPNQINDYEKSSYSNSEMQQLSFLVDTMLHPIKMYEEEIGYKLLTEERLLTGEYCKINEKAILRASSEQQATALTKYVQTGIYTPNEARSYLDKPKKEGGDELMCNGNFIPVASVGKKGGKK